MNVLSYKTILLQLDFHYEATTPPKLDLVLMQRGCPLQTTFPFPFTLFFRYIEYTYNIKPSFAGDCHVQTQI